MTQSAGLLLYKFSAEFLVFLVHPGGPFWKNKDLGSWSIPKGEFAGDEMPLDAAIREFEEETGVKLKGNFIELKPVKLKSGKLVHAWAIEGDIDAENVKSNTIEINWPPRSGRKITIPEVDKGGWFTVAEANEKINPAQYAFIAELVRMLEKR